MRWSEVYRKRDPAGGVGGDLEGMSEAEVATALGISPGTVKKEAFVARERLRRRLGDDLAL